MAEQILLQGKILGTEEFLLAGAAEGRPARSAGEDLLAGRSQWITLLCEVLPRALLAELGLARILLGSSGGGQFLVVLPGEAREAAETFLSAAAAADRGLERRRRPADLGHHRQPGRLGRDPQAAQRRAGPASATLRWRPRRPVPSIRRARASNSTADAYFAKELGAKVREASRSRLVAGRTRQGYARPRQVYLEHHSQSVAGRHHAGAPRRALRRRQVGRAGANPGAPRARPLRLGRAARRRG